MMIDTNGYFRPENRRERKALRDIIRMIAKPGFGGEPCPNGIPPWANITGPITES